MEEDKGQVVFEQVVDRGCGIDVHKKVLVATIRGKGIKRKPTVMIASQIA